ncbi:MAG: hypothetical protein EOP49_21325, partial [Sphingobacteriales bacterium]
MIRVKIAFSTATLVSQSLTRWRLFFWHGLWFFLYPFVTINAQCPAPSEIQHSYDSLMALPNEQQASALQNLRQVCDHCKYNQDSTYAKIWHRLGALAYLQADYKTALAYTQRAIAINTRKRPGTSPSFLAKSYFNLAKIYLDQQNERQARLTFQQFVVLASPYPERFELVAMAYWHLTNLFFRESDYQKAIRQAELGALFSGRINRPDLMAANLTGKANCLKEMGDFKQSLLIMQQVIQLFGKEPKPSVELANAYGATASVLIR